MKIANFRKMSLAVLLIICSGALAQNIPDTPSPAPIADPAWSRLQSLTMGRPIVITDAQGRVVHCLFAGVTDAYLFCDPPGNPPGVGFRFDHAEVIGVDLDPLTYQSAQAAAHERNYHPAWISSMIAGGIIVGLVASQNTSAGRAAEDGLIGAGVVGLIGAPFAFLPHPPMAPPRPAYAPYSFRIPVGARRTLHGFPIHRARH